MRGNEPPQRGLHLIEGADDHHEAAEREVAAEIAGRGHDQRKDDRHPAIAGGDPGETRECAGQAAHGFDDGAGRLVEGTALVGLAAIEGDALGGFADPDQREAELGLALVAVGVQLDQRRPDLPGQPRAEAGIADRAPHHVAGNDDLLAPDRERDVARQRPQHADEADEQHGGLQQADAQLRRHLGQLARVLLDALIGIDAEFAGHPETIGATRRQPPVEQVLGQPAAKPNLQHFLQPGLADHQAEQHGDDRQEDQELLAERAEILGLDGVVEIAVPVVEADLPDHVADEDDDDPGGEHEDARALRCTLQRPEQVFQFGPDTGGPGGVRGLDHARRTRPGYRDRLRLRRPVGQLVANDVPGILDADLAGQRFNDAFDVAEAAKRLVVADLATAFRGPDLVFAVILHAPVPPPVRGNDSRVRATPALPASHLRHLRAACGTTHALGRSRTTGLWRTALRGD
jgi:hypothetical protein